MTFLWSVEGSWGAAEEGSGEIKCPVSKAQMPGREIQLRNICNPSAGDRVVAGVWRLSWSGEKGSSRPYRQLSSESKKDHGILTPAWAAARGEGLGKRRARNDQAFGAGKIRQQIPKPEIQASKPCETCPVTKGAWPGPLWASLGLLCGWHSCSVGKGAGEAGYRAGSPSSPADPVARL